MLRKRFLGLTVLMILVVMAVASHRRRKKSSDMRILEKPIPGNGIPEDGGQASGRAQVMLDKIEENMMLERMKEFEGSGTEEVEKQAQEMDYDAWLHDCASGGEKHLPKIGKALKAFMASNNITTSELEQRCKSMRDEENNGNGNNKKRSYMAASAGVWNKCIVPYKFDTDLPSSWKAGVKEAHDWLEKYTGFRFKQYDGNNTQWGLTHNNYLRYVHGSGCWSYVGNLQWNGQKISPCGSWGVATHEIGHALGLHHEQHTPSSFDMLTTHFKFSKSVGYYNRVNLQDVWGQNLFYDISSIMSYDDWMFNVNYGKTITANDPELTYLIGSGNDYYMFEEIQLYHKCYDEYSSCATLPTCEMGGYPSVIDGVCSCRCPEGLDPATRCTTKYTPANPTSWPEGSFTLLKVKDKDCPSGLSPGQMTRWNPAWTWRGGDSHSPGYDDGYEYGHDVCTQTTSSGGGAWPKGKYCILRRGGSCPNGFTEGKMETFGQEPKRENYSYGALPDGEKGQFFEYIFCCRRDGSRNTEISVPNGDSFVWYSADYWGCQQISGMQSVHEFYVSKSNRTARDNLTFSGELPYHYAWNVGMFNTYYCAYYPVSLDCGEVKTFTTETEYTFTTPGYPNAYPKSTECLWHFKSPDGTTMKIEFTEFEVSHATDTSCSAFVELKTYLPGIQGLKFCGHGYKKEHETVSNYLTAKFVSTTASPWKGFSAKITILTESDKCYTGDGKDKSYAGTVSYARSFNPCLPWKYVSNCKISQFDPKLQDVDLSHNYCRNVGTGRMPWCYTQAERCVRENCDACMRDSCYDVLKDCPTLIASDSNFCSKNEHGEAGRCMQSCNFCDSHTKKQAHGSVTCTSPGNVTDISPVPAKTSYNVGDTVIYKCPTSNTERTRTCTSEGTWTHLGYVCSGCPSGWSALSGRCYNWLGWKIKQTYTESKASCAALNSTLVIIDSQAVSDGVSKLTNYDKADNLWMWLGMTPDDQHQWTWDDGTPVEFGQWESGQPNDYGGYQKCTEGSTDGGWNDVWCNYDHKKYTVVCTYKPSATFVCEDDLANCEDIVEGTPDLCEAQTDYVWVNCRKTCKVSGCSSSVTCSDTAVANAQRTHGADTVNQGQYVEYECNAGYLQTGGDTKRACLPSGQFTGSALVCIAQTATTSYEMLSDREIWRRGNTGDSKRAVVGDGPSVSTKIQVPGKITAWTFYSNFADSVTIQVWRPDTDTSKKDKSTFTLVGQNTINPTADNRKVTVQIAAADQIQAQVGDVVGFYMKEYVIGWTRCDDTIMPEHSYWYRTDTTYREPTNLAVNTSYSFELDSHSCRIYSIRATLNPSAGSF